MKKWHRNQKAHEENARGAAKDVHVVAKHIEVEGGREEFAFAHVAQAVAHYEAVACAGRR